MFKILVIDDVKSDRTLILSILRREFQAVGASSPKEAIEIVKRGNVDLCFIDYMLGPEMDGIELQSRLLKIDKDLKVVIVTALNSAPLAAKALKRGACDYILKPIEPYILIHLVRKKIRQIAELRKRDELLAKERAELAAYKQKYGALRKAKK